MAPAQLGPFFARRPIIPRCNLLALDAPPLLAGSATSVRSLARRVATSIATPSPDLVERARAIGGPEPAIGRVQSGGAWNDSVVHGALAPGARTPAGARTAAGVRVVPVPWCVLSHRRALRRCAVRRLVHRQDRQSTSCLRAPRCGLPPAPARSSCSIRSRFTACCCREPRSTAPTTMPAALPACSSVSNWNWTTRCGLPSTWVSQPLAHGWFRAARG